MKSETHVLFHLMAEDGFPWSSYLLLVVIPEIKLLVILFRLLFLNISVIFSLHILSLVLQFDFSLMKESTLERTKGFLRKVV